ncbi:MAG TPA: PH domain-containing protein [Acidimicrobiales bacterium]|nr:PH domain-containing protein [Acidimicrobiales bacterium]
MPLPRKFLNDDEELLAELRPHWIFFAGPLSAAAAAIVAVVVVLVVFSKLPTAVAYILLAFAAVPTLWFVGRLLRWRNYTLALTTTRILVRKGILDRDIVQLRLQRITEINLSQQLWERILSTGRLIVDVQGEDDAVVLEYVRKPAIVQRVINGQINELTGGGRAEIVPDELRRHDRRSERRPVRDDDRGGDDRHGNDRHGHEDTPPFGTPAVADEEPATEPGPGTASVPAAAPTWTAPPSGGASHAEVRDRLIELDDLRQRGILSEAEFAAKKAELLGRM